jgi:hypothetical protein
MRSRIERASESVVSAKNGASARTTPGRDHNLISDASEDPGGNRPYWVAQWIPRGASLPGCRRGESLWVAQFFDGKTRVFRGSRDAPPTSSLAPIFYVHGDHAYRDEGFVDGPSSVPYLRVRRRGIYPDEGYVERRRDLPVFRVVQLRYPSQPITVRRNPLKGRLVDGR